MAKPFIFARLARAAMAFCLLGLGAVLGGLPATAQTGSLVDLKKKVCAASDLPANPTPAQIGNCASSSAAIGETVYYVLTVINTSIETQNISLTDPLPANFVQTSGAQCQGPVTPAFAAQPSVWAGSTGPWALPPGLTPATCIIEGYFAAAEYQQNTATFLAVGQQSGTRVEDSSTAGIDIDPTKPLPGNLSIVKTADKTVESLTANGGGSVTVTYTITVTNTGAGDLYTGGYLQVVDNLAALPSSGIAFGYSMGMVNCVTTGNTPLCPTLQNASGSGNTTNQSNGIPLGVWQYNAGEDGLIPAGDGFVITMEVTYEGPEGCIYPGTLNGVQNTAYMRFATDQSAPSLMAFSDMDVSDNTSSVDLEITDHGIDEDCPVPAPDELTIEKVQKDPSSGIVPWGTPVEYRIIVTNPLGIGQNGPSVPAGPAITNIAVTDLLALLPGMPNVTVTTLNVYCVTDPNNCIVPPATVPAAPFAPFSTTLNQLSVQVPVANVTVLSLADGQSEEISVTLSFKPLSCVSYVGNGMRQTANFGKIDYQIQTPIKNGFITSTHSGISAPVITDHDKVPDCTLKVEKMGPDQIVFGQPFTYQVSYQNYGPDPIDIGTLLDAMAIDVPNYAASLGGTYTYSCSTSLPNLIQAVTTPTNISIGYNTLAPQGTRLLQTLNPALPVPLPGMTTMDCKFTLTLNQPAANNPYCMSKGYPRLVNAALMDVSHYFNTNLPVPPQAYATTAASLPLCSDVSVKKIISPSIVAPGGLATVTLEFHSKGDQGSPAGAMIEDTLKPGMVYVPYSLQCSNCIGPLVEPSTTGPQIIKATFGNIPPHGKQTVTFKVTMTGPAPSIVENIVTGIYDPAGNWYDQSQELMDHDSIGVFDLYPIEITKNIINSSPGQPPNGPFTFGVNCGFTYQNPSTGQIYSFPFTGTASVTLPNATATVMGADGTPMKVPAGAICTFTETGLPSGSGGYGFSAVGYSPAAPNGNAGQITIVAGSNDGLVENCYGTPAVKPLLVQHDVGKECPPVIVEEKTEIFKTCGPAMPGPGGRPWYANCTVTVATNGQFPPGLTVSDNFYGSTGVIVLNSISPAGLQWTCVPSPSTAPGPHTCTFVAGAQTNPGPNTATFDYTVSFAGANEAEGSKNCAILADREGRVMAEDCTGFEVKDIPWPDLKIDKVCKDPEKRKYAIGAAATGLAWFSDCEITVSASGPLSGPITVTDTLGSSPNGGAMIQALSAAGWACTPMPAPFAPVAGPVTCTLAGPFPANGPWVISATVMLPPSETFAKNCVELAQFGRPIAESCAGIAVPVEESRLQIEKVVINNAPGSVAGLVFPITSTCGPNTTSPHSSNTVGVQDRQKTVFSGMQGDTCTITEGPYPTTTACGKLRTPVWTTKITPSLNPSSTLTLTLAANNPQVTVTNTLNCRLNVSSNGGNTNLGDILVPNPVAFPMFTLTKTCLPAVPVAGANFAQALCTITVTQTAGAPVHQIVIQETLMTDANGAQIVGFNSSTQGWTFPAVPVAADATVTMQLAGNALTGTPPKSTITAVVQLPNAAAATGSQNCVSLQGFDPDGLELASVEPVCVLLQNGTATVIDPKGDGPALELTHASAGPCREDREKQAYTCLFNLDVANISATDFVGPDVISQTFGDIRPVEIAAKGEGWDCRSGGQIATCVNGDIALLAGGKTSVEISFVLPAQRNRGQFTNCARLGIPEDKTTRVLLAQQAAQAFGLDIGQPDGVMGPKTRAAVSEMQERLGLPVTAEPDNALFAALGLRVDKGIAPLCVTVDLPAMDDPECRKGQEFVKGLGCQPIRQTDPKPAPVKPVEKTPKPVGKPLQCDPETTVLRNGQCECRKQGTVKLTETTCG